MSILYVKDFVREFPALSTTVSVYVLLSSTVPSQFHSLYDNSVKFTVYFPFHVNPEERIPEGLAIAPAPTLSFTAHKNVTAVFCQPY